MLSVAQVPNYTEQLNEAGLLKGIEVRYISTAILAITDALKGSKKQAFQLNILDVKTNPNIEIRKALEGHQSKKTKKPYSVVSILRYMKILDKLRSLSLDYSHFIPESNGTVVERPISLTKDSKETTKALPESPLKQMKDKSLVEEQLFSARDGKMGEARVVLVKQKDHEKALLELRITSPYSPDKEDYYLDLATTQMNVLRQRNV